MRRLVALTAAIAATSFAGSAAPAHAQKALATQMHVFGTLSAVWEGDPARGCAQAGVCGVNGSLTYKPGFVAHVTLSDGQLGITGSSEFGPAHVRVRHGPLGGEGFCSDIVTQGFTPFLIMPSDRGAQITFGEFDLSAGRCAGPRHLDLVRALPRVAISAARLRARARVVNLSGRTRFAAGPFTGTVVSSVQIAFTRARATRSSEDPFGESGSTVRQVQRRAGLQFKYRVTGVSGELTTDFRGKADASCIALGACGATGSSAYSLADAKGEIFVFATRPLRRGARLPRYRSALRALRRGRLPIEAFGDLSRGHATVTERFTSPYGTCSDSLVSVTPGIDLAEKGRRLKLRLQGTGPSGETVRTRCAGPSEQDVLGGHSIAHGAIPLRALGQRRLRVVAASAGAFGEGAYAGTRHGRLVLTLERVRASVVTETITTGELVF